MGYPRAYEPIQGQKYQLFTKYGNEPYEHCDYAVDDSERNYLLNEYRMAYGREFTFKVIKLPSKYWKDNKQCSNCKRTVEQDGKCTFEYGINPQGKVICANCENYID